MAKIITMGEVMLRLSTPSNKKFIQTDKLDINYDGGEANIAVSLANYGHEAEFVTAVLANPIGECAMAALRRYSIGTKHIARNGKKLSIYFLETGSAMRASNMVYDRAHSSISIATADQLNFGEIFADAGWFHFTGITPAVSDTAIKLTEAALKAAEAHSVTMSVDLDSRKKLWSSEKAQRAMTNLTQYVDVYVGNEEDAEKTLGFKPGNTDVISGKLELAGYVDIFGQMTDRFGFKYTVSSLRESHNVSNNSWSIYTMDGEIREFYRSRKYHATPIISRAGGGDSFATGLICGLVDSKDMEAALEYAIAASALKHTIPGDFNLATRADVENLAGGDGSGRVQR